MQFSKWLSLTRELRILSKQHEAWAVVYRQYMLCILMLVYLGLLRGIAESVTGAVIGYVVYLIMSHPPVWAFLTMPFQVKIGLLVKSSFLLSRIYSP